MEINDLESVLIVSLIYLLGVVTGLGFCAKYRNIFLQRSRSNDNIQQYNHHQASSEAMDRVHQVQGFAPALPSAPDMVTISLKN